MNSNIKIKLWSENKNISLFRGLKQPIHGQILKITVCCSKCLQNPLLLVPVINNIPHTTHNGCTRPLNLNQIIQFKGQKFVIRNTLKRGKLVKNIEGVLEWIVNESLIIWKTNRTSLNDYCIRHLSIFCYRIYEQVTRN